MWEIGHLNVAFTYMTEILTYFIGHTRQKSAVFVVIASIGAAALVGCSHSSDAQLNSAFSPTQTFGPSGDELVAKEPALNDRISNRVLDQTESDEVVVILESVVHGDVLPMRPAVNGIRFEDSPRAMTSAAKIVEMGILSTDHEWPRVEFSFSNTAGASIPLVVTLKNKRALVRPGITTDDSKIRRDHAEVAAAMTRAFIRSNPGDAFKVEELGRKVISEAGMQVVDVQSVPEKYVFNLIMLDGQPAELIVTRESLSGMASWETRAGLFNDSQVKESLEKAFASEMRAWGRILRPTQVE